MTIETGISHRNSTLLHMPISFYCSVNSTFRWSGWFGQHRNMPTFQQLAPNVVDTLQELSDMIPGDRVRANHVSSGIFGGDPPPPVLTVLHWLFVLPTGFAVNPFKLDASTQEVYMDPTVQHSMTLTFPELCFLLQFGISMMLTSTERYECTRPVNVHTRALPLIWYQQSFLELMQSFRSDGARYRTVREEWSPANIVCMISTLDTALSFAIDETPLDANEIELTEAVAFRAVRSSVPIVL